MPATQEKRHADPAVTRREGDRTPPHMYGDKYGRSSVSSDSPKRKKTAAASPPPPPPPPPGGPKGPNTIPPKDGIPRGNDYRGGNKRHDAFHYSHHQFRK